MWELDMSETFGGRGQVPSLLHFLLFGRLRLVLACVSVVESPELNHLQKAPHSTDD